MTQPFLATGNQEQGDASTTASAGLTVPKALFTRLLASVRDELVWAQLAAFTIPPSQIPGSSVDIDLVKEGEESLTVKELAEGQDILESAVEYETQNLKPKKYGIRVPITSEMVEDGKFALLQQNMDAAGYKVGRKIERLIIDVIDANDPAGNVVAGGATLTWNNITSAINKLEANAGAPYKATDMILGTSVAQDVRNMDIFVEADKADRLYDLSAKNPRFLGVIPRLALRVWLSTVQTATDTWVIDRRELFANIWKRMPTVKQWDQFIKDMKQSAITFRYIPAVLRANAVSKITTT